MTLVALGLSFALARLNYNRTNVIFEAASFVFGAGSVLLAVLGLALGANPLFSGEMVGGQVLFSSLLPSYLVPGVAALYMARAGKGITWTVRASVSVAVPDSFRPLPTTPGSSK